MNNKIIYQIWSIVIFVITLSSCVPSVKIKSENSSLPEGYNGISDSSNTVSKKWNQYFTDENLVALIDTALKNNQELNIMLYEIEVERSEVRARKGEYLPFLNFGGAVGLDKPGRYTSLGSSEATTEILPGKETPDPLQDYLFGAYASWEIDIWKKLRNAKKSAYMKYLSSVDGRNFMVTNLIAEIASSYYELMALDNHLEILSRNIEIQNNALEIVKLEKSSAKVTELAVRKFEAEVFKNKSHRYDIKQQIVEVENRINFLVGRFPQPVVRNSSTFTELFPDSVYAGVPSQLLENRPDIKQAELMLSSAKLDVSVAKANFYPSLRITGGIGYQAFNPAYLLKTPESLLYSLTGDILAPLINRNALKATYYSANAKQMQAVYNYERTILTAFTEVINQLSRMDNLKNSYEMKSKQVEALTRSIEISTVLFKSARADYMEVLMTQRDALEAKMELIETKMNQMNAYVSVYRALGGGWN